MSGYLPYNTPRLADAQEFPLNGSTSPSTTHSRPRFPEPLLSAVRPQLQVQRAASGLPYQGRQSMDRLRPTNEFGLELVVLLLDNEAMCHILPAF